MGYAFISYSTKNQKEADALRELFREKGIGVWMAPNDIPVGSRYAEVINHAIKNCSCLVLILTEDAQNSTWVGKEVERAVSYRKSIISLQLEDIVLNDEFEFYLSANQVVAVQRIDENSEEIKKVLRAVAACASGGEEIPAFEDSFVQNDSSRERKARDKKRSPTKEKLLLIGISSGAVVILGVILFLAGWLGGYINW